MGPAALATVGARAYLRERNDMTFLSSLLLGARVPFLPRPPPISASTTNCSHTTPHSPTPLHCPARMQCILTRRPRPRLWSSGALWTSAAAFAAARLLEAVLPASAPLDAALRRVLSRAFRALNGLSGGGTAQGMYALGVRPAFNFVFYSCPTLHSDPAWLQCRNEGSHRCSRVKQALSGPAALP